MKSIIRDMVRKGMVWKGMMRKGMMRKGMMRKGMMRISNACVITGVAILSEYPVIGEFNYLQYIW